MAQSELLQKEFASVIQRFKAEQDLEGVLAKTPVLTNPEGLSMYHLRGERYHPYQDNSVGYSFRTDLRNSDKIIVEENKVVFSYCDSAVIIGDTPILVSEVIQYFPDFSRTAQTTLVPGVIKGKGITEHNAQYVLVEKMSKELIQKSSQVLKLLGYQNIEYW